MTSARNRELVALIPVALLLSAGFAAVFAQETVLASRSAINEVTFRPAVSAPSPILRGIDFTTAPSLTGYVVTLPKGRSQLHLTGPEGDPILASWSVGITRRAAREVARKGFGHAEDRSAGGGADLQVHLVRLV